MPVADAEAVFSLLDRELWLLTAAAGKRRAGLVCTLVSQASIIPDQPRVWVGLSPQHHTTGVVRDGRAFLLHLVREEHLDLVWRFGTCSGRDEDKFAGTTWEESSLGLARLPGAVAWLECKVDSYAETGDRIFFLASVCAAAKLSDGPPLTVQRFQRLLSPAQKIELRRLLLRDACIDADLVRRWTEPGYWPLTTGGAAGEREA